MGSDLFIVNCARVSFNRWKDEFEDVDRKLLRYLAEHHHDSPFFHPQVCFRVTAPIYVARQLYRHEVGASKNEVSRRYVTDDIIIEMPEVIRGFPKDGRKQGSSGPLQRFKQIGAKRLIGLAFKFAVKTYDMLLELGVAPEQARIVLPLALQTKWIWTGSLSFYSRVCRDRLSNDAQEETRQIAVMIDAVMRELFPESWPLLIGEVA